MSIVKVFANGDNRLDPDFAGALQHLIPVLIKAGVANMGMHVNQFGCWQFQSISGRHGCSRLDCSKNPAVLFDDDPPFAEIPHDRIVLQPVVFVKIQVNGLLKPVGLHEVLEK